MNSRKLESYCPKLRKGIIAPSGRLFVFKVDDKQVELPFAMADLVLLCDGRHSIFQIIDKMHQKQGVVHFQKLIDTLILLYEGDFIENEIEIHPLIADLKMIINRTYTLKDRIYGFISTLKKAYPSKEIFLRESIRTKIERNSFFSELREEALDVILNSCEVILFSKGQTIIDQEEEPTDIYLLLEGQCEARTPGFSGVIEGGSFFGEAALRANGARSATVKALKSCQVLRIPVSSLHELHMGEEHFETLRRQIIVSQFFGSSPHFQGVSEETIERFQRSGQLEIVDSEVTVFEDGDPTSGLYFLVRGSVRVEVSEEKTVRLNQGDLFGEISVMAKLPRTARVVTEEPCFLFKVSLEAFWEILLTDLEFAYRIERLCEMRLSEDLHFLQEKNKKAGSF